MGAHTSYREIVKYYYSKYKSSDEDKELPVIVHANAIPDPRAVASFTISLIRFCLDAGERTDRASQRIYHNFCNAYSEVVSAPCS
jgi:hypothetical protein